VFKPRNRQDDALSFGDVDGRGLYGGSALVRWHLDEWPNEQLSRGEVMRCLSLVGADALPKIPDKTSESA
jgi:hypothetical protein